MARIRANMAIGGGGSSLNPTSIKNGVIASHGSTTCTIDTSKTYIVSISANYTTTGFYLDTYVIKNGEASYVYDSSLMVSTLTISGTTATLQSGAGANTSYQFVQLD